jgi:hypothetical protein
MVKRKRSSAAGKNKKLKTTADEAEHPVPEAVGPNAKDIATVNKCTASYKVCPTPQLFQVLSPTTLCTATTSFDLLKKITFKKISKI